MKGQIKEVVVSQRNNNSSDINEVILAKIKPFIEYCIKENDNWKDALVMSKAGNSFGKCRYW